MSETRNSPAGIELAPNSVALLAEFAALSGKLDLLLQDYLKRGIPGLCVGMGSAAGERWLTVAGHDDLNNQTALTLDHAIGAGSITKTFVTVVAMQLVEANQLDLDTPLSRLIGPNTSAGIANAASATIEHLMNHSSGIPSWEDDKDWIRDARGSRTDTQRIWGSTDTLDYIKGKAALFAPGEKYSYSNTNFTLLGLAIQKITGLSIEDEISQRICRPLALNRTYLEGFNSPYVDGAKAQRYHYKTPGFMNLAGVASDTPDVGDGLIDVSRSNLSTEWATGGIVTTIGDMLSFAMALRDGKLLSAASLQRMQEWRPADQKGFAGLGLFRRPVGNHWGIGHTGNVLGATGSFFWIEGSNCVVAILSNIGTMHTDSTAPGAADFGRDPRLLTIANEVFPNFK